jgi:hypothetical protein
MAKMVILENPDSGERVCVPKPKGKAKAGETDGQEGWTLIAEIDGPPPEHAELVDGKFVVDKEKANAAKEAARVRSLKLEDLVAELRAEIAELRDRIDKLEKP